MIEGTRRRPGPDTGTPPATTRLPDGFRVQVAPGVRRLDAGRVLLGAAPIRLLRLSGKAVDLIAGRSTLRVCDDTTAALARRLLDTGVAHPRPSGPANAADVTVVVPVRDRPDGLNRLLAAVRRGGAAIPVIVVDDGSRDALAARRVCARHTATVIRNDIARGPAAARNAGLVAAATPYVAFFDSDSAPLPGWLDHLQPHLEDPLVAVAAPRIVAANLGGSGRLASYEEAASSLDLGPHEGQVHPHGRIPYVPGVALLVRRAALAGGFDDSMHVAEDVDLVWRLAAAGWRIRYEPKASVRHEHPTSVMGWARRRLFYGTGAADLAARHGSAVAPIVVSPWSAAAWLSLLAGRLGPVYAAAILAGATARLASRLTGVGPRWRLAASLVGTGWLFAGRQLASAVVRHFWPVSVLVAATGRRTRPWFVLIAVVDAVIGWWPLRRQVRLPTFLLFRRLDDLSYGAGLWWGAFRSRSLRALVPKIGPA
ncbi:MAG: mycofactocin biosynthesis glycosyltransferase MftF [Geodermatophilaceae bacterium]|nr:mycofactocin biosynthesis glycosyltransferase MftF [Geodermatophilaceae bacterium]